MWDFTQTRVHGDRCLDGDMFLGRMHGMPFTMLWGVTWSLPWSMFRQCRTLSLYVNNHNLLVGRLYQYLYIKMSEIAGERQRQRERESERERERESDRERERERERESERERERGSLKNEYNLVV